MPEYFTIKKGVSLIVDIEKREAKLFDGKLYQVFKFQRDIIIQDIINIKNEYEKNHFKKINPSEF